MCLFCFKSSNCFSNAQNKHFLTPPFYYPLLHPPLRGGSGPEGSDERSFAIAKLRSFHAVNDILAGTGALVLAAGGIEAVAGRKFNTP